jgi:hypothetical protein
MLIHADCRQRYKVVPIIVKSWCVPQGEQAVACSNCQHTTD